MDIPLEDVALRLGAAVGAGMLVGLNRDLRNKPIGMRTLGLVALGAAVITIATVHMHDMISHPDALSRVLQGVIQGVMAGIGFIGAGVIMRDPEAQVVQGLTTAATVWITAALGVACGLAAWPLAGLALGLALFVLAGVGWLERLLSRDDR